MNRTDVQQAFFTLCKDLLAEDVPFSVNSSFCKGEGSYNDVSYFTDVTELSRFNSVAMFDHDSEEYQNMMDRTGCLFLTIYPDTSRGYKFAKEYNSASSQIRNEAGWPWGNSGTLNDAMKAYMNDQITHDEMYSLIEIFHNHIPNLLSARFKVYERMNGSSRWQEYAKTWSEEILKKVKFATTRGVEVVDTAMEFAYQGKGIYDKRYGTGDGLSSDTKYLKFIITFNKKMTYAQRKAMMRNLTMPILNWYSAIQPDCMKSGCHYQDYADPKGYTVTNIKDMYIRFDDSGRKCQPTDKMFVYVKSNSWIGFATAPETAFIPRMGMGMKKFTA